MAKLTQAALKRYGFSVWKSKKFKPQFPGQQDERNRGKMFSKGDFRICMYNEDKIFRYGEDYYKTLTTTEQLEALHLERTGETLTPVNGIN